MTPGRLAKCGLFILGGWVALALGASLLALVPSAPMRLVEMLLSWGFAVGGLGAAVLFVAGLAKVIQIGVSAKN